MTIPVAEVVGDRIRCQYCRRVLATMTTITKPVPVAIPFGDEGMWGVVDFEDPIGANVTLEPGFVNAQERFPEGACYARARKWYPGRKMRPLKVRLPAVIICDCDSVWVIPNLGLDPARIGNDDERRATIITDIVAGALPYARGEEPDASALAAAERLAERIRTPHRDLSRGEEADLRAHVADLGHGSREKRGR